MNDTRDMRILYDTWPSTNITNISFYDTANISTSLDFEESEIARNGSHEDVPWTNIGGMGFPNRSQEDVLWNNIGVGVDNKSEEEVTWTNLGVGLSWALQIHIYGFACLFFMLAFYTFFSILNLR